MAVARGPGPWTDLPMAPPPSPSYISPMLGLPPLQGQRAVFRDLRAFFGRRSREQTKAALLSVGITGTILVIFFRRRGSIAVDDVNRMRG